MMNAGGEWILSRGLIPLEQQVAAVGLGQQRQFGECGSRSLDDLLQQHFQMLQHPGDGQVVEEVCVVLYAYKQTLFDVCYIDNYIELGSQAFYFNKIDTQFR